MSFAKVFMAVLPACLSTALLTSGHVATDRVYIATWRRGSSDLCLFGSPSVRCTLCISYGLCIDFGSSSVRTLESSRAAELPLQQTQVSKGLTGQDCEVRRPAWRFRLQLRIRISGIFGLESRPLLPPCKSRHG